MEATPSIQFEDDRSANAAVSMGGHGPQSQLDQYSQNDKKYSLEHRTPVGEIQSLKQHLIQYSREQPPSQGGVNSVRGTRDESPPFGKD